MLHVSYVNNVIKYKHTHTHKFSTLCCARGIAAVCSVFTTQKPWQHRIPPDGVVEGGTEDLVAVFGKAQTGHTFVVSMLKPTHTQAALDLPHLPQQHTHISKEKSKDRLRQQYIHKSYGYSYWSFILSGKYTHKYEPIQPLFCHSELQ